MYALCFQLWFFSPHSIHSFSVNHDRPQSYVRLGHLSLQKRSRHCANGSPEPHEQYLRTDIERRRKFIDALIYMGECLIVVIVVYFDDYGDLRHKERGKLFRVLRRCLNC